MAQVTPLRSERRAIARHGTRNTQYATPSTRLISPSQPWGGDRGDGRLPRLLLGERQGNGVAGLALAREAREAYLLVGQARGGALVDELGHDHAQCGTPHHPVAARRQDEEALARLVDDRQVVRRVVDRGGPGARDRLPGQRRPDRLPHRTRSLVVLPVVGDLVAPAAVGP